MRSVFASWVDPTEAERGNTATFYVEAFGEGQSLPLTEAFASLTDPEGNVTALTAIPPPVDLDPLDSSDDGSYPNIWSADSVLNIVGLWTWQWTVVPTTGPTGTTSGTVTIRDNTGN